MLRIAQKAFFGLETRGRSFHVYLSYPSSAGVSEGYVIHSPWTSRIMFDDVVTRVYGNQEYSISMAVVVLGQYE
jgi:hypothetical protein